MTSTSLPLAPPRTRPASTDTAAPAAPRRRAVGIWLLACCAFLYLLLVVGGITRLTRSGLSITEWQPIMGTLPPLSEADWHELFAKYQRTPEYQLVNRGMTLDQFESIFWWEYVHRLLARLLGVLFVVPLAVFALRRRVDGGLALRLGGVFLLGAAQGAMGWYMVASGLVAEPRVSHLRLAAHFGLALAIFAAMLWLALGELRARPVAATGVRAPGLLASAFALLVFVQALVGALVAGTHAGLMYPTFPLMDGRVVPAALGTTPPWWRDLLYNPTTIQFTHRTLAWLLVVLGVALWWRIVGRGSEGAPVTRTAAHLVLAALGLQFALGVATLLLHVPLVLAVLHQAGAVLLLAAALNARHATPRAAG